MVFLWNFLWSCTQLQTHRQPTNPETTNALAECKQGRDTLNLIACSLFSVCLCVCLCVFFFSGVRLLWSSPGISSDPVRDHCVCDPWTYSQWTTVPWTHCLGLLFSLLCGAFVLLFNSHTCCSQLLRLLCWRRGGITLVHWPVFRVRSSAHVQYWTLLPGEKQTQREETPIFAYCLWEKESFISAIPLWFFRVKGTNPRLINLQQQQKVCKISAFETFAWSLSYFLLNFQAIC